MSESGKSLIHTVMAGLRKLMPPDETGENKMAVQMFGRMLRSKDLVWGKPFKNWLNNDHWPVTTGTYTVGSRSAPVAVCTLTSPELMEPLSGVKGVAISGRLVTVNLGIEKVILNTISNPNIRYLLLCGNDSPVFNTAQALRCLFRYGVDSEQRIKKAEGHYPVLGNIKPTQVETFLEQVELVDCTGERELDSLRGRIGEICKHIKPPFEKKDTTAKKISETMSERKFKNIMPGGKRETPVYDPKGFFVIMVDRKASEIVLRHYKQDNTPAHEMRGRRAESMMRGLIREELISQISHAGYLGLELGKAETALRLGIPYEQDHPLKEQ